ncbi:helix-turn-helix domain-containing protein [Cryptosporangium arvum]|uniref:helix-turn-helix domain-containing protein n=1 Tax=Cryptosporangium arvum TaxID=80871 RepID=UPI0004BBCC01|nr:helix-turn-helix transcriptional regulator [Cryptosporangium arvum]
MSAEPPGGAPALRRLEVAAALRQHRKAARMTTAEVTRHLGFSYSKLSRLETGDRRIRPEDLERLCDLYGIDVEERHRLATLVDESHQTSQWQNFDTFQSDEADFMELEQAAYRIDDYKSSAVTTLLQTRAYSRAYYGQLNPHLPADILDARVATRDVRRSAMFARSPLPTLNFILDEAAVRRLVGGPATMAEQVDHLVRLAGHEQISIQVLPFAYGAHIGMDSLFAILSFREAIRDRVYVDGLAPQQYFTEAKELERYRAAFDQLSRHALDRFASREFLKAIRNDIDTPE